MEFAHAKDQLLRDLQRLGITDPRVLQAIGRVPRERFVPPHQTHLAYANIALSIECDQTISQPYIVGLMSQLLELDGTETVLDVGTGSGYQAAILAELARQVITIERIPELSQTAAGLLNKLGYDNIEYHVGDGTLGVPERSPFAGILVAAAAPRFPASLYAQLQPGGRLIIPLGDELVQRLEVIQHTPAGPQITHSCECRFVKLLGAEAWPAESN